MVPCRNGCRQKKAVEIIARIFIPLRHPQKNASDSERPTFRHAVKYADFGAQDETRKISSALIGFECDTGSDGKRKFEAPYGRLKHHARRYRPKVENIAAECRMVADHDIAADGKQSGDKAPVAEIRRASDVHFTFEVERKTRHNGNLNILIAGAVHRIAEFRTVIVFVALRFAGGKKSGGAKKQYAAQRYNPFHLSSHR